MTYSLHALRRDQPRPRREHAVRLRGDARRRGVAAPVADREREVALGRLERGERADDVAVLERRVAGLHRRERAARRRAAPGQAQRREEAPERRARDGPRVLRLQRLRGSR